MPGRLTIPFFLAPIMGLQPYEFDSSISPQWLEQTISPPRDLEEFTMIFQILTGPVQKPGQIACYGDRGDNCRLSVVINANLSLEITIESTR